MNYSRPVQDASTTKRAGGSGGGMPEPDELRDQLDKISADIMRAGGGS